MYLVLNAVWQVSLGQKSVGSEVQEGLRFVGCTVLTRLFQIYLLDLVIGDYVTVKKWKIKFNGIRNKIA